MKRAEMTMKMLSMHEKIQQIFSRLNKQPKGKLLLALFRETRQTCARKETWRGEGEF